MKSPHTGKEMVLVTEPDIWRFRGEDFPYIHYSYICEETGERYTTDELDMKGWKEVTDSYREKHGIVSQEFLREFRKRTGFSCSYLSSLIGIPTDRYEMFENGEVPTLEENELIKAFCRNY